MKNKIEISKSIVFFVIIWTVAHYVRGEILQQMSDFAGGIIGKAAGVMLALGFMVLKIFCWKKSRGNNTIAGRMWEILPWAAGILAPFMYVFYYFATAHDIAIGKWLSIFTELLIPVSALVFVYILLTIHAHKEKETTDIETTDIEPVDFNVGN